MATISTAASVLGVRYRPVLKLRLPSQSTPWLKRFHQNPKTAIKDNAATGVPLNPTSSKNDNKFINPLDSNFIALK